MPEVSPAIAQQKVHAIERFLSHVLRAGVILSSIIVTVGVGLMFVHHPGYLHDTVSAGTVIAQMAFPHTVYDVMAGLARGEGRALIILGLFVLIATPVVRVAASLVLFLHLRDHIFSLLTTIVLLLLLASFLLGRAGG
ncbi:MAG TPA: DUF1634 domain-containing protein [Phycisphaerae bacterium]|nr:DUF1634 domain-containing protein [Phycisphaerae bacterium]